MISNVKQGQTITASGQNEIIDSVNKLLQPNQTNGSSISERQRSLDSYSTLFQVKSGNGWLMTERPSTYSDSSVQSTTWIQLGKSLQELKMNTGNVDDVYILGHNGDEIGGKLQDSWIKRNGMGYFYDGWFDLQYQKYNPVYCIFVALMEQEDQEEEVWTKKKTFLCIDNTSTDSEVKSDLENYVELEDNEKLEIERKVCIANYTDQGMLKGTSSSSPQYRQLVQLHIGALLNSTYSGKTLSVDSEIEELSGMYQASIQRCELSGEEYLQLYRFSEDDRKELAELTGSQYQNEVDVLLRVKNEDDGDRKLEYVNISSFIKPDLSTDTEFNALSRKSIEKKLYENDPEKQYIQLRNYELSNSTWNNLTSANDIGIVTRVETSNGKDISYFDYKTINVKGDSQVTTHSYSIKMNNKDGYFQLPDYQLYDWTETTQRSTKDFLNDGRTDLLLRHYKNGNYTLRYAKLESLSTWLSGGSEISGDANLDSGLNSIILKDNQVFGKYYELYDWEEDAQTGQYGFSPESLTGYWENGNNSLVWNNPEMSFLIRNSEGSIDLEYHQLSCTTVPFTHGDADQYVHSDTGCASIEHHPNYDDPTRSYYSLWNFEGDSYDDTIKIEPGGDQIDEWMTNGSTDLSVSSNMNQQFITRNNANDVNYCIATAKTMPFIHGDADQYVGNSQKSISHNPDVNDKTKSYYELYNWRTPGSTSIESTITESSTELLGEGWKFLVRDENGILRYVTIALDADIAGDSNIQEIWNEITSIWNDIDDIHEDINYLSSQISSLTGDYWVTGGESDTNNCNTASIDNLESQNITAVGSITTPTLDAEYGGFSVKCTANDLEASTANIGTLEVQNSINVLGGNITLGNTTLTESQLQRLLELIQ